MIPSKLRTVATIVKTAGLRGFLFYTLYKRMMRKPGASDAETVERLGRLTERTGIRAKVEGITICMDSKYVERVPKGLLMLGRYEAPERDLAARRLPKNEPVIELGASIGVVTCVVNRLLASRGDHVAVEAHPGLIPILKKHRTINRCKFSVVHAALAYDDDQILFYPNEGSLGGSVHRHAGEAVPVPCTSLQVVAESHGIEWFNLICDIEGSELDLIKHEVDFLQDRVHWIFMEFHPAISGAESVEQGLSALQDRGFELVEQVEGTYCFRNARL